MQDIFIQSKVIDIFPELKMAVAAILDLFGWVMGPPTKPHSWCVPPVQILSWSAKYFSSYKDLNFFSFRLESPIHAPKISFFGGILPPEFSGTSFRPPKGSSLSGTTRLSPRWSRSDVQCDLWSVALAKKTKKRKKDSGKLAIRPDHPRCRISKSKFACRVASGV